MPDWIMLITAGLFGASAGGALVWGALRRGRSDPILPDTQPEKSAQPRPNSEYEGLHKELRRLSSLLNLLPFPAWRRDAELKISYCNLTYNAMLEDVSERILEEYGLELIETAGALAAKAKKEQKACSAEHHLLREGSRHLYRFYEIPDTDSGGTIGFAIDATDEEKISEELRRHIRAHSNLLETSNMATAIFDAQTRLKFYNNAFIAMWKLDRQWLATEPLYSEIIEHLREKRRMPEMVNFQHFKQQRLRLFTDLMDAHEEILHLPDDKIVRLVIIPHALGGLIFSFEDVTDKFALERSYNTLIAVQRETLNNLYEGIAVFGEDGRLRLCNPAFQILWGLHPDFLASEPHIGEILEQTKSYYTYADWQEFKQRTMEQMLARSMNYQRVERTDSSVIDWSTVPLPDGATLVTYFDVTDSTLVERSLIERNNALREADHLKTEFLLSVSYELRSPLTSITGFSDLLQNQYFGGLSDKQRECVQDIHTAASQLGQLINNILDLASIEAGYMRLNIQEWQVKPLLKQVVGLVKERAKAQHQSIKMECADDIGCVQADELRLKQVLFNLLNNAVKYTPQKGKIKIGAFTDETDNLVFWVTDNGVGISAQEQESVFERFRPGAVRTQYSGAGFGLAMVKNLIELHGGRVEMESTPNIGTTVRCYIPRKNPINSLRQSEQNHSLLAQRSEVHEDTSLTKTKKSQFRKG